MASRKDYVAAANSIRKIKNPRDRARMVILMGKTFAADNPRFRWQDWRAACGFVQSGRKNRKGQLGWFSDFVNW